jgi:hypothetical protein
MANPHHSAMAGQDMVVNFGGLGPLSGEIPTFVRMKKSGKVASSLGGRQSS